MILYKPQLVANITNEISDNSTGQISPHDIRHNLLDIIDSVHLCLIDRDIQSLNFATPATRTTRGGSLTLDKLALAGYSSEDNVAFGYSALAASYQTARNTAVGSYALSCDIYGTDNVGVGYTALGGTTNGIGNVGLGNFALVNNKVGNFNVAIGHGAGYYVTRDTCDKLFIASHHVDSDYICANPLGSGLIPLVYGDFASGIFGINVRELHGDGVLQVGGDVTPSSGDVYDVGSSGHAWSVAYLRGVDFGSGIRISRTTDKLVTNAHILPTGNVDFGGPSNHWRHGYFGDITVSGTATMYRFNAYEHYEYFHKTIHLAASGEPEILDGGGPVSIFDYAFQPGFFFPYPLLDDEQMSGAGLIASTSGIDYRRDYGFVYNPPSSNHIPCESNGFASSAWVSNISLVLDSGNYFKTNRIISYDNCFGLFFDSGNAFIGRKNILDANPSHPSGNLAGLGRVNLIGNSGVAEDYITAIAAQVSGVTVSTRWLTNIAQRTKDIDDQDMLTGCEVRFVDTSLQSLSTRSDRMVLGSYNNASYLHNTIVLMKDSEQGIFGLFDMGEISELLIPKTTVDIRTTGNAIIRSTTENVGPGVSSLQLLGELSCEYNGFEAAYLNGSGMADLSMFQDSGKQVYLRLYEGINNDLLLGVDEYRLGILNTVSGNLHSANDVHGMLSLGSHTHNYASLSLYEFSKGDTPSPSYPTFSPGSMPHRGIIYIGSKIAKQQVHSVFMADGSGNIHDLIVNKYDATDGRGLYTDDYQNTLGGLLANSDRTAIGANTIGNTAFGYKAVTALTSGDYNTVIGANAGSGLTSGLRNTILGANSARNILGGKSNIILGEDAFNAASGSYNIIIGNAGIGSGLSSDYNLLVGMSKDRILLHGKLGPNNSDKHLMMPSGGKFSTYNSNNSQSLTVKANTIEVTDHTGNDYPNNELSFVFTGNESATLFKLNHDSSPMSNTPTYAAPSGDRPFGELKGDLKLQGAVRFSDGTSLESVQPIDDVVDGLATTNTNLSTLSSLLGSLVIEGTAAQNIPAPSTTGAASSGNMIKRNTSWDDIGTALLVNRDKGLSINMGDYVVAIRVNNEYRPLWVSNQNLSCSQCP